VKLHRLSRLQRRRPGMAFHLCTLKYPKQFLLNIKIISIVMNGLLPVSIIDFSQRTECNRTEGFDQVGENKV
jgi:hypothetical protein